MKAVGLIMIFLSAVSVGFIKGNGYKDTEREIGAFIDLLYFIRHEISSYLTPQGKIYEKLRNPILEERGFLDLLRRFSEEGAEQPLLSAVEECRALRCGDEAASVIKEFSETLGRLSVKEQCHRCDRAISALEDIHKRKKVEALEKTRLCRSVGCMIGLGLVLLLW